MGKVLSAVPGNIATFDSNGEVSDTGLKPDSFTPSKYPLSQAGKMLSVSQAGEVYPTDPTEFDVTPFIKVPQGSTKDEAVPYITTAVNQQASVFIIDPVGPGGFTEGIRYNRNRGASAGWGGFIQGGRWGSVREDDTAQNGAGMGDGPRVASNANTDNDHADWMTSGNDSSRPANQLPGGYPNVANTNISVRGASWWSVTPQGDIHIGQTSSQLNTFPDGLANWSSTLTQEQSYNRNRQFAKRRTGFNPGDINLDVTLDSSGKTNTSSSYEDPANPTGPRRNGNGHWMAALMARRSDGQVWISGHPVHYPSLNGELNNDHQALKTKVNRTAGTATLPVYMNNGTPTAITPRTSVREQGSATNTDLVTEAAIRAAVDAVSPKVEGLSGIVTPASGVPGTLTQYRNCLISQGKMRTLNWTCQLSLPSTAGDNCPIGTLARSGDRPTTTCYFTATCYKSMSEVFPCTVSITNGGAIVIHNFPRNFGITPNQLMYVFVNVTYWAGT